MKRRYLLLLLANRPAARLGLRHCLVPHPLAAAPATAAATYARQQGALVIVRVP